jgi:hypothetical protein
MLFVTTTIYGLGRQYGLEQAPRAFELQLEAPGRDSLPVVRNIVRLRTIEQLQIRLDCGSSSLAKCRSRAFHAALASGADTWIAIDDDVEATRLTLEWMIEAVQTSDGVCIVPYLQRGLSSAPPTALVTFQADAVDRMRELRVGGKVAPAIHGGFGLVAVSHHAMVEIAAANQHLAFDDDDGVSRLAVFHELIASRKWWGEDLSFFRRVPTNVPIEALITGESSHQGNTLHLEDLIPNLHAPALKTDPCHDPPAPLTPRPGAA